MFGIFKALLGQSSEPSTLLLSARSQILETLDSAYTLLAEVRSALGNGSVENGLGQRARAVDKASNKAERELRKILVEHLSFSQTDGPLCLVMMSVGKDVERLVDECRNIADIVGTAGFTIAADYYDEFIALTTEVQTVLKRTRDAFATNDEAAALDLVESEKPFIARAHVLGDRILADPHFGVRNAVMLSRGIHILHRLRAHLANIASTVVFPVHRIDFAKRSYIDDARKELGVD